MHSMKISKHGIDFIKSWEKEILTGYDDKFGFATIGVGHRILKNEPYTIGTKITVAESSRLLVKDLARFEREVKNQSSSPLTQNQYDACVSLLFNIGTAGFHNSSVLRFINEENFPLAAKSFLLWNKVRGKIVRGLVNRRKAEKALFEKQ